MKNWSGYCVVRILAYFKMVTVQVAAIGGTNNSNPNFAWSMNPLLIWMKLIGIDLGTYENNNIRISDGYKSKLFTASGYLLLVINMVFNLESVYNSWNSDFKSQYLEMSSTFFLNRAIDQTNYSIRNIAVHACLLQFLRGHWKKLWKYIEKIGHFMRNETQVYRRFRILSIVGIIYILFMVNRQMIKLYIKLKLI